MSNKYSTIFHSKLPAFIRDDPSYSRFIDFFDAYYAWFDETYDIYGFGDKLDIDSGFSQFYEYYVADFLPFFPDINSIAADKIKLLKIIKELYKAKGTPDSFKFLFRALYNVNAEVYATSDYVLKPSDGKWIIPKSVKIKSLDPAFLNVNNLKIFGETSQSIAVIEKSKVNGKFTQIYLSEIRRLFNSAENIRILDHDNNQVYALDGKCYLYTDKTRPIEAIPLTSKIIGSISNVKINPTQRGNYYKIGDPIIFHGGFDTTNFSANSIGATAVVSEVTTGQIQKVIITDGGFGYRIYPNSEITVVKSDGEVDPIASCIITRVDESLPVSMVSRISNDCIEDNYFKTIGATKYNFSANTNANANTKLKDCFNFVEYPTYPIQNVVVVNGGGGYTEVPSVEFHSTFNANTVSAYKQNLVDLGILASIKIVNGGENYNISDTISISDIQVGVTDIDNGALAQAHITSVNATGAITGVEYYYNADYPYSIGGMGYSKYRLPVISVATSTGANAELVVPGILGSGAEYTLETDRIGSITKISLIDNGEDYISAPDVSLRIQDIAVTGNTIENIIPSTCYVYQGDQLNPTFYSEIYSTTRLYFDSKTNYELFSIRLYDFIGEISALTSCNVYNKETKTIVSDVNLESNYSILPYKNGIKLYGDGSARATSVFLNGLIEDEGRYLNSDGQLSSHSVLQSDTYNLGTYVLVSEKNYDSYKDVVKNLLHPIGMQIIPKNILNSNSSFKTGSNSSAQIGIPLTNISGLVRQNSNTNINFSNIITIYTEEELDSIFTANSKISITGNNNLYIYSTINSIDSLNSTIELEDYIQYKFPNVYNGYTDSNTIIVTRNNYTDKYSMNTFISVGDNISMGTNIITIDRIENNILYFPVILDPAGDEQNTANVSIIKNLESNNIITYTTV